MRRFSKSGSNYRMRSKSGSGRSGSRSRPRSLRLENLETRELLALTHLPPPPNKLPFDVPAESTSEFMLGEVLVNVVLFESTGSENTQDWTAGQKQLIKSEIQEGAQWWRDLLTTQFPTLQGGAQNLNFHFNWRYLDDSAAGPISVPDYEPIAHNSTDEAHWIGDFLSQVQAETGQDYTTGDYVNNVRKWTNDQRLVNRTDWSVTVFVVNSAQDADGNFADGVSHSARLGGPYMVMTSDNGDMGAANMGQVFAHELGRVFYALDEGTGGEPSTARSGYYNTQNLNVVNRVPSIMLGGSVADQALQNTAWANHVTSPESMKMVGWQDTDGDHVFDVLDVAMGLNVTGIYDRARRLYSTSGDATVNHLANLNPQGPQPVSPARDATINQIDGMQFQINRTAPAPMTSLPGEYGSGTRVLTGVWSDGVPYGDYVDNVGQPVPLYVRGDYQLQFRTVDVLTGVTSNVFQTIQKVLNTRPTIVGNTALLDEDEQAAYDDLDPPGTKISQMIGTMVHDAESDYRGVAIVGLNKMIIPGNPAPIGKWQYKLGNGAWQTIDLDQTIIANDHALVLDENDSIRFLLTTKPPAGWSGLTTQAVTFRAWDQTDGSLPGTFVNVPQDYVDAAPYSVTPALQDGTAFSSATAYASLHILRNNAPVINPTQANPKLDDQMEGDMNARGTLVSDLITKYLTPGGDLITDVDGDPEAIAVIGGDETYGHLEFTVNDGATWSRVWPTGIARHPANAIVLIPDALTRIRFVPDVAPTGPDFWGTIPAVVTFRAWDQTWDLDAPPYPVPRPVNGGRVNADSASGRTGGTTPFSADPSPPTITGETASLTILPVNDAPRLVAGGPVNPLKVREDNVPVRVPLFKPGTDYAPGGYGETDNIFVKVNALPYAELGRVLLADGTPVTTTNVYSEAQLVGMVFELIADHNSLGLSMPAQGGPGPGPQLFDFQVYDDGRDYLGNPTPQTNNLTTETDSWITVWEVNDTPVSIGTPNLAAAQRQTCVVAEDSPRARIMVQPVPLPIPSPPPSPAGRVGLLTLDYGPGGWTDEALQRLTYHITQLPNSDLGTVYLSDGTPAQIGTYTLQQIRELEFEPKPNSNFQGPSFATAWAGNPDFSMVFTVTDNGTTGDSTSDGINPGAADPKTLTQQIWFHVYEVNDGPTAQNDQWTVEERWSADPGDTAQFQAQSWSTVLLNDRPGQPLNESLQDLVVTRVFTDSNTHGTVTLDPVGRRFLYTPDLYYNGPASFEYIVEDRGTTGGLADYLFARARVDITILDYNNAPELYGTAPNPRLPEDSGPTSLGLGSLTFSPGGGVYESNQTLTYRIAVLPDPALGTLLLADGVTPANLGAYLLSDLRNLKFRPQADQFGVTSFVLEVRDNGTTHGGPDPKSVTATIPITVWAVNDPPIAVQDRVSVSENDSTEPADHGVGQTIDPSELLKNDYEGPPNERPLTPPPQLDLESVAATVNTHGTVAFLGGKVYYQPEPNYAGPASFSYIVRDRGTTDGRPDTRTAVGTVFVTVSEVNDPPVLVSGSIDEVIVPEDSPPVSLGLDDLVYGPGGGADEALQRLTYRVTVLPSSNLGKVVLADGQTPAVIGVDYLLSQLHGMQFAAVHGVTGGPTSFAFSVVDDGRTDGQLAPGVLAQQVGIRVAAVNDPPSAFPQRVWTAVNTPIDFQLQAQDNDPQIQALTYEIVDPAPPANYVPGDTVQLAHGTLTINVAGQAVYTPAHGYEGYDRFTFRVWDDNQAGMPGPLVSDPATVTLVVGSPAGSASAGVWNPLDSSFFLKESAGAGPADWAFQFGPGNVGWMPLAGDWDGASGASVGLYNPVSSTFYLVNSYRGGAADVFFDFGVGGLNWQPLVGDWNGDGVATVGLYDPQTSTFYLRNSHQGGAADVTFNFGIGGHNWQPIVGDWDNDGYDSIGLYDPATGTFFLNNELKGGPASVAFVYGVTGLGWQPLAGDWDGAGGDSVGLYAPATSTFFLNNRLAGGNADVVFDYGVGGQGWRPIMGDWDAANYPAPAPVAAAPAAAPAALDARAVDQAIASSLDASGLASAEVQSNPWEADDFFGPLRKRK